MIKNHNIICISSIDWDFVWQGHQEIMSVFVKNGNRVLFIENTGVRMPNLQDVPRLKKRLLNWFKSMNGFREEAENLFIYSPLVLPCQYSIVTRFINRRLLLGVLKRWMSVANFNNPIIWTFLPTGTALDIINNVDHKLLVYYCIADFYELVSNPKSIKKTEDELIKKCDLIFVQGDFLKKRCERFNDNVHIFPFGVDTSNFDYSGTGLSDKTGALENIKKPIIGYIGGIHKHVDFLLLASLAKEHPEWSIVLIGPQQTSISEISSFKNIHFLGKKLFCELPEFIRKFHIGIIPYKINSYTATVFPTKLNEYHAVGLPVVSTELPEVIKFNQKNDNLVSIARTYEEFSSAIVKMLNGDSEQLKEMRKKSAQKNGWNNRITEMSALINASLEKKYSERVNWEDKFVKFYSSTRRKSLNVILVAILLYTLIFYTPLIWILAEPLKIDHVPESADCIVVFAGGVGESGKAGQGYEERVGYAVQLYKAGFAKHLIFSSGYTHFFKEPFLMKALAVSLGIPEQAIFLEDRARNTYENVKFSEQILDRNNWREILLISSPYHMRRVSLVFNRVARKVKVTYAPIIKSEFYFHDGKDFEGKRTWQRINLRQIKGILHEYLGIVYYWWRGWI